MESTVSIASNFKGAGPLQGQLRPGQQVSAGLDAQDADLMRVAQALEASFLAEMLKQTGLGKTPEGFGGGAGEDQFSGFLAQIRAEQMVEAGGVGLAERIFEDLKARVNGDE
jgi:Rod binding domain-containing protein